MVLPLLALGVLPKSDFSTFSFQCPTNGSAAQSAANATNSADTDLNKRISTPSVEAAASTGLGRNCDSGMVTGNQRYKVFAVTSWTHRNPELRLACVRSSPLK